MPASQHPEIDAHIDALRTGETMWAQLTVKQRVRVLQRVRAAVSEVAEEWATIAAHSKGLDALHPLRGEEWLTGPYAVIGALDAYIDSLKAIARGGSPLDGVRVSRAPGNRVRAHVFPLHVMDKLLLSGFEGEVWLRPGVDAGEAQRRAGLAQLRPGESGGIGLVLGAGNITSIPVLDVFYELLAFGRVALLKLNPTQDALRDVFTRALQPLIGPGFVRIVSGDGAVGAFLTRHRAFSHVHITGSVDTFDAIVWGKGATAMKNRAAGTPKLKKPITAELGGVSPIIVVPGPWSEADLRYHAEHVVTMRMQNSGHNCIAGQVVVLSRDWPQKQAFVEELRAAYARVPERPVWYPRSDEKLAAARAAYTDVESIEGRLLVEDPEDPTVLETTEFFSPVLGVIDIDGVGREFLHDAIAYANDKLAGSLGANILIDPSTERALGAGLDDEVAELRYGGIAINAWSAFSFITPTMTWGAFPGGTLEDVGSGIGVVHNALLLDSVERSILRGPFRPLPRSLGRSKFSVLPKPPWFATSRTGAEVSEGFTRFRMDGKIGGLLRTLVKAFGA